MPEEKKTTDQLIESMYGFVKTEFKALNTKIDGIETRLERIENKVDNNHDSRLTRLEDTMRVVKTKLGFT